MLKTVKEIWNNPYLAPLTQPFRNIGTIIAMPLTPYTVPLKAAFDDERIPQHSQGKSRPSRICRELAHFSDGMGGVLHFMSAFVVGSTAAWGAGVTLFGATAGAGIATQAVATFLGVTVGATLGIVAAPVVVATAIATVALVVGTVIGVVPGVISGTAKALQYHRHKDLIATADTPPQDPSQAVIARVVGDFTSLPQDVQAALVEDLGHIVTGKISAQDKILQAAEKLSDAERVALIEKMRQNLAVAFSAAAEKQIAKAAVPGDSINVVRPIRLRNVNKTKAPGGLAKAA